MDTYGTLKAVKVELEDLKQRIAALEERECCKEEAPEPKKRSKKV